MNIRKIIALFERANCCVTGERGSGKDMLFANVIARRNKPYISNCEYKPKKLRKQFYQKLDFDKLDCGKNTWKNFVHSDIKHYQYPYIIGSDVYVTDVGVYLPSQYCNEINRDFPSIATFSALSRQIGRCNFHINVQSLNRCYDKIREQSHTYITCLGCKVLSIFGHQLVIQKVRLYSKYESCLSQIPPLSLPLRMRLGKDKMLAYLYRLNYKITHGDIKESILVYWNKSDYDTLLFEEMLKNGKK